MILFPAIDLLNGQVVRLKQGEYDEVTQYHQDPLTLAQSWSKAGAEWGHMVDLDAAKAGFPVNRALIAEVAQKSGLKIQVGGGVRTLEMARAYLEDGVQRVVVGTKAVQDPHFLAQLGKNFPGKVALGLDAKLGKIAIQGWTETTGITVEEFLKTAPLKGIACLIYTDIERDGMLTGPNIPSLKKVLQATELPVISSGGVSCLQDIQDLVDLENCKLIGTIVGKALYEGKFSLEDALKTALS